jgi:heterodisulfide reductase subunit C
VNATAGRVETAVSAGADFLREVETRSGQPLSSCYGCLKCSAGCPTAHLMDVRPHALLRMLQTGMERQVMESRALWLCVACGTCGTRCPNGIDIGQMLDTVREMAIERKVHAAERNVHLLHEAFVRSLGMFGRLHEASFEIDYKIRSLDLLTDVASGVVMFARGKLPLLPSRVKGISQVRELFRRCGR